MMVGLAVPFNVAGLPDEARAMAAELLASPEERFQAFGRLAKIFNDAFGSDYRADRAEASLVAAREVFERLGDELGLTWAYSAEWALHWNALRTAAAGAAAERAAAHARAAGDQVLAEQMRHTSQNMLTYGPTPFDEALVSARADAAEASGPVTRAKARRNIAKLLAMLGEVEAAREGMHAGNRSLREAGLLVDAAAGSMLTAFVEIRAGSPDLAEAAFREGIDELGRLGNSSYRGTCMLLLADLLADRGAYDEASSLCSAVRDTLRTDDLTDVIMLDSLEGFLAAHGGAFQEGERLSTRAVEAAATIDMYDHKARAYEWHARTLAHAGKPDEARQAAATAHAIYEAKGDIPASARARDLVESLSPQS
jgi:hypothetical protein